MRRWHYHGVTNQPHHVHRDAVARADHGRRRRQLHHEHPRRPHVQHGRRGAAPGRRRAALVRRDDRLLGRRRADHVDVEHPGLEGRTATPSSRTSCRRSRSTRRTATPRATCIGLNHEGIFYDPEALVEPIRIVRNLAAIGGARRRRSVHVHRVLAADLSRRRPRDARRHPARRSNTRCPTCTAGRGAQIWEKYHEHGHGAARGRGHLQLRLGPPAQPRQRLATAAAEA